MTLQEYVLKHVIRASDCRCGRCCDSSGRPVLTDHTIDNGFFFATLQDNPSKDDLLKAITEWSLTFGDPLNLFDGEEHSYIEMGRWIGDQGLALSLMSMGALLGLWQLLTPKSVLGDSIDEEMAQKLAGMGMVTIKANPQ